MDNKKMSYIMAMIIENFINGIIDRTAATEELFEKINPVEIYDLDIFMITDCYWAIRHLTEDKFETTVEELQYFYECLIGKRQYSLSDKNEYIEKNIQKKQLKRV